MSVVTAPLTGPEAWLGRDMAASTAWIRPVSAAAVAEIDAALTALKRRGLTWPGFGREDFPLPTFGRELAAVLEELEGGRGFALLRGFPVERDTDAELKDLSWGLNNHVIYHACTAYEDAEGPGRDRLLLRLWLAPPNSRALPEAYTPIWGATEPGVPRGGIAQPA